MPEPGAGELNQPLKEIKPPITQVERPQIKREIPLVQNDPMPDDPSRDYEYAYHATRGNNFESIRKKGLLPSSEYSPEGYRSKEPGTVWFNSWEARDHYLPRDGSGALFRVHISYIPEFLDYQEDGKYVFKGVSSIRRTVPPEFLDYSFDGGKTWIHDPNYIDVRTEPSLKKHQQREQKKDLKEFRPEINEKTPPTIKARANSEIPNGTNGIRQKIISFFRRNHYDEEAYKIGEYKTVIKNAKKHLSEENLRPLEQAA